MKKTMKLSALVLSLGILAACAMTPAEKAAQAQERAQQMLDTQVSLAQQCSPEAAQLMKEMPNANKLSETQKKVFEQKYVKAVNNQAFQACYNMAWKDYREQNAMQAEQMAVWANTDANAWNDGFFYDNPFAWDYPF
ncbi:MAG TPA: hypothetical protein H9889_06740 [Candidatus Ignatzschineria merdigallinarum]|uniref:Lipoprotein n=1 Tax=Candidatus Ignatzschineria merdigallinarum TaxID=2838621 RepID=A0A9D1TUN4_9GAMM|nr:hypothetical protein [Candidatus Ignatzschineria merdigallinarum]